MYILCNRAFSWLFSPIPERQPLSTWNFPSNRSDFTILGVSLGPALIVCVNRMTQDGGLATPERPTLGLEGWGFELCDICPTSEARRGFRDGVESIVPME